MGFEQLEGAVLQKAKKEADMIIRQAEEQKKELLDKAKAEISELRKRSDEEIGQQIDMMQKKEIAQSQLEAKKKLLMTRKEMIDKVFVEAVSRLDKGLKKADRKEMMRKHLKRAEKEIDVGRVLCSKADLGMLKGAIEADISGGLIAESRDKKVMVDYSFETRLEEIKERHIKEITERIFR